MTDIRRTYTVSGADLKRQYPVSRAIDALIDLVPKIAWFEWGYAEGSAAGQEVMRAECDRDDDGKFVAVQCTGCGCGSGKHYPLVDYAAPNAAREWNRRHPSADALQEE